MNYRGDSRHATSVDHWVCAVHWAPVEAAIHVACSIRWADVYRLTEDEYEEAEHPGGRRSNDVLHSPDARIVAGSVLRICRGGT